MSISESSSVLRALLADNQIDIGKINNFEGFVGVITKLGQDDPQRVAQFAYNNILTAEQRGEIQNRVACMKATAIVTGFVFLALFVIGILTATRAMPPTFAGLVMAGGSGIVLLLTAFVIWNARQYYQSLQIKLEARAAASTTSGASQQDLPDM